MNAFGGFRWIQDPDAWKGDYYEYDPIAGPVGDEMVGNKMIWYEKRDDPTPDQMLEQILSTVLGKNYLDELLSFPIMGQLPDDQTS